MKKKGIRENLKSYENDLQSIISTVNLENRHNENNYSLLSEVLNFIKSNTDNLNSESLKQVIFLLGATGAGKSTLLNYLMLEDAKFILAENSEDDIQLSSEIKTDVAIGNGEGSTTLFPNLKTTPFGNFLDCAGEGDTGGILAEVINSIIKRKLASNVEQAKILFVSQQVSLGAGGAYGESFKQALDKNSQFLQDINYFKDSMGLVITKAGVSPKVLDQCDKLLQNILKHNSGSNTYKEIIEEISHNKKFTTFSKPFKFLEEGEFYAPPSWNLNQKGNITNMISDMPFTPIPKKDFFNTSSTPQVRETMQKAMEVVVLKVGDFINQMVVNAQPFTLFSVEMKPFAKYVNGLSNDYSTELLNYLNILAFNDYLKVNPEHKSLEKMNEELKFLFQFTQDNKNSEKLKVDWGKAANVKKIFKNAYDGVKTILSTEGNNFSKFKTENNVKTIPSSPEGYDILNSFSDLYEQYVELDKVKSLGAQQNSKYYKNVSKKNLSYMKKVPCKYTEEIVDFREITKYRTESYTVEEEAVGRTIALGIFTLGIGTAIRGGACTNTVTKTRKVPYTYQEKYIKEVEKTRYKEEPVYNYFTVREKDQDTYNSDKTEKNNEILKLREEIEQYITKYPKGNLGKHNRDSVTSKDKYEKMYEDLQITWQNAEYEAYFANNPNKSLEELTIDIIGDHYS
jgi:energy-coupling factor transporter ATP-binding protein EcfA2